MSQIHPSMVEQIISHTLSILTDGIPRSGREIAEIITQRQVTVDKKIVNQVLYHHGKPRIVYDPKTYTYALSDYFRNENGAGTLDPTNLNNTLSPTSNEFSKLTYLEDLRTGMYVRIPVDEDTTSSLAYCRDFRIGQIELVNASDCRVILRPGANDTFRKTQVTLSSALVRRCRLLPNLGFRHIPSNTIGIVLCTYTESFPKGEYLHYFVLLGGQVQEVSEADIEVESHAQAPDPVEQQAHYEFHRWIWKTKRDQLLQSYIQLQTATFGMEELVGSRILLLPHQAETIARVLGDRHCRYVLADEVGLGKTVEACVILKGLKRRNPQLKTLIIAPRTLIRQWHHELNQKFWLDFSLTTPENHYAYDPEGPGILMSVEDFEDHPRLADGLLTKNWDLLIVDEAHRLHRNPALYNATHRLSAAIPNCLVLSATPILRHASEYLSLLRLMHPHQYDRMSITQFEAMLSVQGELRKRLAYVGRALNDDDFEMDDFEDEIRPVIDLLPEDTVLKTLFQGLNPKANDKGLGGARELHSYLSENYRIESRVIRNRRASLERQLSLPIRSLDDAYSYSPTREEREVLAELVEYAREALGHGREKADLLRAMFYAAASSPFALQNLVKARRKVTETISERGATPDTFPQRTIEVVSYPQETTRLDRLEWRIDQWIQLTLSALEAQRVGNSPLQESPHRLLQVLRAIYKVCAQLGDKALIFCRWTETHEVLQKVLLRHYGKQRVAIFSASKSSDELQAEVDRFQSDLECQIMLSDESGGEGRNFQIASVIIHVDLPWMPAQIEQRIGRVDRLGREGTVTSIVPYARNTVENDLFQLWHSAFSLFTHSMSGMEIVLESVQDNILAAFAANPADGLAILLDSMRQQASKLREMIEEERYAEESAAQNDRREDLARTLDDYRNGEKLKHPLLKWADLAGLASYSHFDRVSNTNVTIFDPKKFNQKSIQNAKFVNPPNMEEALRRSGRQRKLQIKGTFNRDVAIQREDLVFFAPGEPWTDALILNALYADRGKSSAVMRSVTNLESDWEGFECLYSIQVDPRPLYSLGADPIHLFFAQGYLSVPCYSVIIGIDGQVVKRSNPIWSNLQHDHPQPGDVHLGQRSGNSSPLSLFMERFSPDEWQTLVRSTVAQAEAHARREYEFTSELAQEAAAMFERKITGQRAAYRWLRGEATNNEIDEFEQISALLVEGIAKPRVQLESMCFWWLKVSTEERNELS